MKAAFIWMHHAIVSLSHVNAESAAGPYIQLAYRVRKAQSQHLCIYSFGFLRLFVLYNMTICLQVQL
jgi:hypothetical protein